MTLIKEEVKTTEVITAENAAELEPGRATYIDEVVKEAPVDEWLVSYLKTVRVPEKPTSEFLLKVGEDALHQKIQDVEIYNMAPRGGKKRLPEKLGFDDVAIIMASLFTFKLVKMTDRPDGIQLSMYVEDETDPKFGLYVSDEQYLLRQLGKIAKGFREIDLKESISAMTRICNVADRTKDKNLFAVNNGIYNSDTEELLPFSRDYVFRSKVPVDYNPDAVNVMIDNPDGTTWDVESWISDIMSDDPERVEVIWQVIADSLQSHHSRGRAILFYSTRGNNGKGTIGQLIKNMVGRGNYSSLSVKDFSERFYREALVEAMVNIADENQVGAYIDSSKEFKASVTGDDILVERKGVQGYSFQFHGANIQMINELPRSKDKSKSFYRRIIIIPFDKSFTNNGERKYIKDDYIGRKEVLEYVLLKVLKMDFDEYTEPRVSVELLTEYAESNNTVLDFWSQYKGEFVWDLLPYNFIYDCYKGWFKQTNPSGQIMNARSFKEEIKSIVENDADSDWYHPQTERQRHNGKMDDDEPLISEFNLDTPDRGKRGQWMNQSVAITTGTNSEKLREFKRKTTYAGLLRK